MTLTTQTCAICHDPLSELEVAYIPECECYLCSDDLEAVVAFGEAVEQANREADTFKEGSARP